MRLFDADEFKERFRWSEVCRLSISEINKIIDSEPTAECVNEEEVKNIENELKKVLRKLKENNNG